MHYCYERNAAHRIHQEHGGVLLDLDDMYVVCPFHAAVELRAGALRTPLEQARYWAIMAECGFDETEPRAQHVRPRRLMLCLDA